LPFVPDSRKEAEIRYRILTTIEANQDRCPTATIREGALHGNDTAFDRMLGDNGVFMRTKMVQVFSDRGVKYYGRTERGKEMQNWLKWAIAIDNYTGGEAWKK